MSVLWINGTLFDKSEARVSPFDHGFLYGEGVWEALRAVKGRVVRQDEHLADLFASAAGLGIEIPLSRGEIAAAIETTLAANTRTEGYIRAIVTRGVGTVGPDPRKVDPQVIIIAEQYHPFPRELYGHGLHAVVYPEAIDSESPLFAVRALGQPHVPLAKRHALTHGCLEAIFVNRSVHVVGATEGQVFAVKSGVAILPTPQPPEAMGAYVAALAETQGLTVREEPIRVEDLRQADEVFLAGTAAGVIAINRLDGRDIGLGTEGQVTRSLRETIGKA